MGGEDYRGLRLLRRRGVYILAVPFYWKFFRLPVRAGKFAIQKIADLGFVAGNRFDVDELPGECDDVHGREDNRCFWQCNLDTVSTSDSHIKSLFLDGPAGRLEALLNGGAANATHAALVCHPHPIYGGTLHNKVVFHTAKALNSFGYPVLRFNFRGAGLSQGEHDSGSGEVDDVRVALDWLEQEFRLPLILAGFSFGAAVGLRVACPDPRVQAVIGLGLPLAPLDERMYEFAFLGECYKPKLFFSGARDQFGPRTKLEALVNSLPEPKQLILIEGADHFFEGRLRELREAIESWVRKFVEGSVEG